MVFFFSFESVLMNLELGNRRMGYLSSASNFLWSFTPFLVSFRPSITSNLF